MTITQLIECLLGKVVAFQDLEGDARPFADVTVDDISAMLHSKGIRNMGMR